MIALVAIMYVLVVLDTAFSGICAASGRNALIHKQSYYARSMLHGVVCGHVAMLIGLFVIVAAIWFSPDSEQALQELEAVGWRMADVYIIYAAVVLLTFCIRAIPSVDIRSLTSTLAFGPLTVIRPAVIAAGIAWGLMLHPGPAVTTAALTIALLMMPFRIILNWVFAGLHAYRRYSPSSTKSLASD